MRLILTPAIAAALVLTWLPPNSAAGLDTPLVLADDSEQKKDRENDEENATGDEEPECE